MGKDSGQVVKLVKCHVGRGMVGIVWFLNMLVLYYSLYHYGTAQWDAPVLSIRRGYTCHSVRPQFTATRGRCHISVSLKGLFYKTPVEVSSF